MKTVADMDEGISTLVTDAEEIEYICQSIGKKNKGWGCLFVDVDEEKGEYITVYACKYSVPLLSHTVRKIH